MFLLLHIQHFNFGENLSRIDTTGGGGTQKFSPLDNTNFSLSDKTYEEKLKYVPVSSCNYPVFLFNQKIQKMMGVIQ